MSSVQYLMCFTMLWSSSCCFAQQSNRARELNSETDSAERARQVAEQLANEQQHVLKYKFQPSEEIRWEVEHTASTKTQMAGNSQSTSSRTKSTKLWKVSSIDKLGNITFVHSVEDSELWQQLGDDEPVAYDTKSDAEVPQEFQAASQMVGKPLAILTISPSGKILDRKSTYSQLDFGVGDICIPMPEKPIAVGYRWYVPTEFNATDEDGKRLKIKARIHYELAKVVAGQAYISFRTEVLTPMESDQIRSQLLQKLSQGYAAFDIEQGRLSTKVIEWNEKVQGFSGPDSLLHYVGKMTEQLVDSGSSESTRRSSRATVKIKGPEDKPIIRK